MNIILNSAYSFLILREGKDPDYRIRENRARNVIIENIEKECLSVGGPRRFSQDVILDVTRDVCQSLRRLSSEAEQRFRKAWVLGSNPRGGSFFIVFFGF